MTAPPRLSLYFAAYFLYAGAFMPYFTLYLAARGLDAAAIALVMAMPQVARIAAPSFWGWLADRSGHGRAIVIGSAAVLVAGYAALASLEQAAAIAGVMLAMSLALPNPIAAVIAVGLLGAAGFATVAPLQLWVLEKAGGAGTSLASSLNIAAFNLGNALGAWLGGVALEQGLGLTALPLVGAVLPLLALSLLLVSLLLRRNAPLATSN